MRILHVLGKLDRGGAETWLVQTLRHIDRSKYQFDFLVHTDEPGAYDDEVRSLGSRVIPCLSPSNPVKYARNFLRILKEYGPYDCVHSHVHYFSGYVLAIAKVGGVSARIAHSHCDTRVAEEHRGVPREGYLWFATKLLKHCATIGFAVSDRAAQSLFGTDWKTDPRWRICELGIDLEPFSRPDNGVALTKQLGIAKNAIVIGHVGRFFPQKNHVFLVGIAEHVCASEPDAVFLLVGDGPLRSEIEASINSLGLRKHFVFAGVRSDVPALMKDVMDCFLFPSAFEGLGLVLIEAQAAGLRCLISDVVPEEVDVVPALLERLSLKESPEIWARRLLETTIAPSAQADGELIQRFSIEASAANLSCQYAEIAKALAGEEIRDKQREIRLG